MRNFRLDDESGHQEALFEWAAYHMDCMPELEYMHHIPNGGKRDKRTAVALKKTGRKSWCAGYLFTSGKKRISWVVHRTESRQKQGYKEPRKVASIFERPRVLCSDLLRVA